MGSLVTTGSWMVARIKADLWIYALIAVYTIIGVGSIHWTNTGHLLAFEPYKEKWARLFLALFPSVLVLVDAVMIFIRFDRRRILAFRRMYSVKRIGYLVSGTVLLMSTYFFQGTFTSLKNAMVAWNGGFSHDVLHADIDKWLHFGVDPWRHVDFLINTETMLKVTQFNYNVVYFVLVFAFLYFACTSPKAERFRAHFVVCFMLAWIVVGNIFAASFVSAGPVYYGHVTGDTTRFAELMQYINAVSGPGSVADTQNYLWTLYSTNRAGFGSGISAFPSVHVGLATLVMYFAFDLSRKFGYFMIAYTVLIAASSVALAWHYAIDGYVSFVIVTALYFGLKPMLRSKPFYTQTPSDPKAVFAPAGSMAT